MRCEAQRSFADEGKIIWRYSLAAGLTALPW